MRSPSFMCLLAVIQLLLGCADPPAGPSPGLDDDDARRDDRVVGTPVVMPADEAQFHLWVMSPWSLDAIHDPWSLQFTPAERWFFGPLRDVTWAPEGPLYLAAESGAVVTMDASLRVDAVVTAGLASPCALAADEDHVFVSDGEHLLTFDRALSLHDRQPAPRMTAMVASTEGLFGLTDDGRTIATRDRDGQWRSFESPSWDVALDIGYGPDGALYVVDGGPCVFLYDDPQRLSGSVAPARSFCRQGRQYRAVIPAENALGYLAHDDGIDVVDEVSVANDEQAPRHVIARPDWPPWRPTRMALGWAR